MTDICAGGCKNVFGLCNIFLLPGKIVRILQLVSVKNTINGNVWYLCAGFINENV